MLHLHAGHPEVSRFNRSWILGIHCMQTMKDTSEGIYQGFETQGRYH